MQILQRKGASFIVAFYINFPIDEFIMWESLIMSDELDSSTLIKSNFYK